MTWVTILHWNRIFHLQRYLRKHTLLLKSESLRHSKATASEDHTGPRHDPDTDESGNYCNLLSN